MSTRTTQSPSTRGRPSAVPGLREQAADAAGRRSLLARAGRGRAGAHRSGPADLNAFRVIRAEEALAEADEADRRLGAGEGAPLLGVPVAIKDDVDLAGHTDPLRLRRRSSPRGARRRGRCGACARRARS